MEENKDNKDEQAQGAPQSADQQAPADALSRTPDDLAQEEAAQKADQPAEAPVKKEPAIKRLFRKINIYFLIFILLVAVGGAITIVNYLNSQKEAPAPDVATQQLTQDALKQLANTDTSVGNSSQTLTIQGNAVITGQTLMRGNLNLAGNFQSGGSIQGPSITISGAANFGQTQINSLQVATTTSLQGLTTLRDINVAGAASFSGAITASQITVTNLIMSGNAKLQVPNHIAFTGPSPARTNVNTSVLGSGGSASVNGSDTTGTVNVNTGGSPTTGCFITLTFNQAFTTQPHVIISPVGAGAGDSGYYVTRSFTTFSICFDNTPPANQQFSFDYFVTS